MDSFELQLQLAGLLTGLNSSKQASIELCNFLIRNYVNQEDLYPVLIETLPKLDINKRLNFFQFIDDFLTLINKDAKLKDNDIVFNYAFLIISDLNKFLQYILPQTPTDLIESSQVKRSEIRTLSNLHFCYSILIHISKLFNLKDLDNFETKYNSNLLSQKDTENINNSILFDESELYNKDVKPTKSSHVDDYVNSSSTGFNDDIKVEEETYIPEQINQGLLSAWEFITGKRKQSQYEALLIDCNDDPFNTKHTEQQQQTTSTSSAANNNISPPGISTDEALESTNINTTTTMKTPVRPAVQQTPSKSNTNSHILSLTQNLILQRIEADRERQKRGKETLWEVERPEGIIQNSEFEYIYDTLQSFNEVEDKPIIDELDNLYQLCVFTETEEKTKSIPPKPKSNTRPNPRNTQQLPDLRPRKYDSSDLFHPENFKNSDNNGNGAPKRQRTDNRQRYQNDNYNYYNYDYDYNYEYDYQNDWSYKNVGNQQRRNGGGNGAGGASANNNGNYDRRR